ncbi:MAG: hypothetical protein AMXMBFR61_06990 [Fimbriimonadales bacterium]
MTPRASRNEVTLGPDGVLHVRVTAPPADGQANRAVIQVLSRALKVPKSAITILSGESSRTKRVRIEGLDPAAVRNLLHPRT